MEGSSGKYSTYESLPQMGSLRDRLRDLQRSLQEELPASSASIGRSRHLPDDFIEQVRAADFGAILDALGVEVGTNDMAICPFHPDNDPSLSVDLDRGLYHCFGCEAGGDSIDFVERHRSLDFVEACRWIANVVGIQEP
jgi:hypothetical protein